MSIQWHMSYLVKHKICSSNNLPLMSTLSSKVARNWPSGFYKCRTSILIRNLSYHIRTHAHSLSYRQSLFNLTTNTRYCPDGSTFKFGNFQCRCKHVLDKCSVFEDLGRNTSQFELLDNLGCFTDINNHTSSTYPEGCLCT